MVLGCPFQWYTSRSKKEIISSKAIVKKKWSCVRYVESRNQVWIPQKKTLFSIHIRQLNISRHPNLSLGEDTKKEKKELYVPASLATWSTDYYSPSFPASFDGWIAWLRRRGGWAGLARWWWCCCKSWLQKQSIFLVFGWHVANAWGSNNRRLHSLFGQRWTDSHWMNDVTWSQLEHMLDGYRRKIWLSDLLKTYWWGFV